MSATSFGSRAIVARPGVRTKCGSLFLRPSRILAFPLHDDDRLPDGPRAPGSAGAGAGADAGRRTPDAGRRTPDAGRRTPDAAGAGTEHPTPARDDACVVATRYITTFKWQVNVNAGRHRVFRVLSSPKLPPCLSNTRNRTIVLIVFVYGNRPDSRDSGRKKSSEHRRCISRDSGRKKSRLSK